MIFREAGQFKSSYREDEAHLVLREERLFVLAVTLFAAVVVPAIAGEYLLRSILIPFLIFALATIGLNILVGYTGLISLGTAGFMAVGAFAAYKIATSFPWMHFGIVFVLAAVVAAVVGIAFGLPSLRIKGFYLAVTTLAAHFFIEWTLTHFGWFSNYASSGVISSPPLETFGYVIDAAWERYLLCLGFLVVMTVIAKNLVRSALGRSWMAIRDMDVAAEVIGIPILKTKLLAFAISSFYCGLAGALWAFVFLGSVEAQAFDIFRAFDVLFMVIIGGLGSIVGSYLGAGFFVILPIVITNVAGLFGGAVATDTLASLELVVFGGMIVFFLIVEPFGLARIWELAKEKLRLWPFPY
ncbi:branched-chain amino acid ABC transporter permease [Minwuia thermotolerans]|uniref:Branched-chain amino acid ABC transporter permease n=1 Tax=Minwuia thermotolerans TaxID=2056226 RepID=A0A2M9G3J8_9PROT|nr:branched-chain amino acid ABC transporter permease [Minwuia thermotolerans]PJK30285.1 branched-chain amino acid ABC transporter permease [Minwuia thermotolerans]